MDVLNFQNYITIHAIVLILGVILLLWRRPKTGSKWQFKPSYSTTQGSASASPKAVQRTVKRPGILNVHFNYNGHSFDAYEVLGLPAGSSIEKAQAAFEQQIKASDESTREFFEAAIDAIAKHVA